MPTLYFRKCAVWFCLLAVLTTGKTAVAQQQVGIELVLAVDTSVSVDAAEYALQMSGIARAFRDRRIVSLISRLQDGAAVTIVQWSYGHLIHQPLPWSLLQDRESIEAFADAVETTPRGSVGRKTAIGDAIDFSADLLENNTYFGRSLTIDLSGDARSNSGPPPEQARDRATGKSITINGLIMKNGDPGLRRYFRERVVGGGESFVMAVSDFDDFATAMRLKLERELSVELAKSYKPDQPRGGRSR